MLRNMQNKYLQQIIGRVGSQERLADELTKLRGRKITQQGISWWFKNGIPAAWVPYLIKVDQRYGGNTAPKQLSPVFAELRT